MPLEMNASIIIAFGEKSNSNLAGPGSSLFQVLQGTSKDINNVWSWAPVAHACNPSYLGG
jgi:hypothetical protein